MNSVAIKVDGRELTVKAWTVKEKRIQLLKAKGDGGPRDLVREYDDLINAVKENIITGIAEIEAEDSRFIERVWTEIVSANYYVPLPSGATSSAPSSQAAPAEPKKA